MKAIEPKCGEYDFVRARVSHHPGFARVPLPHDEVVTGRELACIDRPGTDVDAECGVHEGETFGERRRLTVADDVDRHGVASAARGIEGRDVLGIRSPAPVVAPADDEAIAFPEIRSTAGGCGTRRCSFARDGNGNLPTETRFVHVFLRIQARSTTAEADAG
ncbi:MAG: hypothetical protein NVSMB64_05630 [Candidatus Velthaea sp.]